MQMAKKKKVVIGLLIVSLLAGICDVFNSSPLSQKGKISLENFVYCHIQVIEVIDDTGIGRAVKIRELKPVDNLMKMIERLEARKALPWEKMHKEDEEPYSIHLQFDSEEVGRCELIHFWKNGEVVFRGDSYMITEESRTQMTDQLEWLIENCATEE